MEKHVECSCQSWLDDFTQWFSWWPLFVRALEFLNNYFLPGMLTSSLYTTNASIRITQRKTQKTSSPYTRAKKLMDTSGLHLRQWIQHAWDKYYYIWEVQCTPSLIPKHVLFFIFQVAFLIAHVMQLCSFST